MTRGAYLEMCVTLGNEPIDSEIPVELEDLPEAVQVTLTMYNSLADDWDYMGGNYIGKNLQNIFEVFKLYGIPEEEKLVTYKFLNVIDAERKSIIRSKSKS